jgi:hypothetical protein
MWVYWDGTGTTTFSRQSFTAGAAPVAGYEYSYFLRAAMSSGSTFLGIAQKIEDVRTFANQTITISFWAKATSSVTITPLVRQDFGAGGSTLVDTYATPQTLTSSWVRYSTTVAVPSISGKTIGTSSFTQVYPIVYTSGTIASNTVDIWGIQVEAANTATAFQTATGTLQGELAACQRYYYQVFPSAGQFITSGSQYSSTLCLLAIQLPVTMRTLPSYTAGTGTIFYNSGSQAPTFASNVQGVDTYGIQGTTSAITAGTALYANLNFDHKFSAEL